MFEALINQGYDKIKRLETNIGLSDEQFEALPDHLKVSAAEVYSWHRVIEHGITLGFGTEADEKLKQWRKISEDWLESGRDLGHNRFGPRHCIQRYEQQIALLREFDAMLNMDYEYKKSKIAEASTSSGYILTDSLPILSEKSAAIKQLVLLNSRALQILKEQQASFGPLYIPAYILLEIEGREAEIKKLQAELEEIEAKMEPPAQL